MNKTILSQSLQQLDIDFFIYKLKSEANSTSGLKTEVIDILTNKFPSLSPRNGNELFYDISDVLGQYKTKYKTSGFVQHFPELFKDTEAIVVNIGIDIKKELEKNRIEPLNPDIINQLNPNNVLSEHPTDLGKIVIITATIAPDLDQETQDNLARNCLTNFLGESANFKHKSSLFGSPIYIYQGTPRSPKDDVFVWLCKSDSPTLAQFRDNNCYRKLLLLFATYQKIVKLTHQHKDYLRKIEEDDQKIREILEPQPQEEDPITKEDLLQLEQKLTKIPKLTYSFSQNLAKYEKDQISIKTNYKNYQIALVQITDNKPNIDITWLKELKPILEAIAEEADNYIQYFQPTLKATEQAIAAIRGIVEIRRHEQERSLERSIQILGSGLGAGSIAASCIANYATTFPTGKTNDSIHPGVLTLLWSLLFAFIGAAISWYLTKPKNKG